MELTQENVEKLNVAKMPDALLCKGLLLDAIEAGDALEKELSNLRQDYRKISELYIAEQNKCGHLEARIKELEEDLVEERGVNAGLRLRIKELESIPHTDNTSVNPSYTLQQLLTCVPTHYSNITSAYGALTRLAKQGVIEKFWRDKCEKL